MSVPSDGSPFPGVALVGVGPWGRNVARVLASLGVLRAAVDPDPTRLEEWHVRGIATAPCLAALPSSLRRELGAAVIAAPAALHAPLTLEALELGLDVLVEKPMALSLRDAESMAARAEARGRILMIGHLALYHPAVEALREFIANGGLGELRYLHSHRLNLGRVRREENILFSFAPHDVALILDLVAEMPQRVSARGGAWLKPGRADVTLTHLEFPGGAQAHVFVSWLHAAKEQRLVVVGRLGMAIFDDTQPEEKLVFIAAAVDEDGANDASRPAERRVLEWRAEEPLLRECRHFLECCRDRRRPLSDAAEGLRVMAVLDEAGRSLRDSAADPLVPGLGGL